jgi:hypothetical protein
MPCARSIPRRLVHAEHAEEADRGGEHEIIADPGQSAALQQQLGEVRRQRRAENAAETIGGGGAGIGDLGRKQLRQQRAERREGQAQKAVDKAYAEGVAKYNAGRLETRFSREEAIGSFIDPEVRERLRDTYDGAVAPYGPGAEITINNRDYDTSEPVRTYKIPDARLRDVSFDWTLTLKKSSFPQIRGFFSADSRPLAVVIVRPSQLGGAYLIRRRATFTPRR